MISPPFPLPLILFCMEWYIYIWISDELIFFLFFLLSTGRYDRPTESGREINVFALPPTNEVQQRLNSKLMGTNKPTQNTVKCAYVQCLLSLFLPKCLVHSSKLPALAEPSQHSGLLYICVMMALRNRSVDDAGRDLWRPATPTPFSKQSQGCSEPCPDGF